MCKKPVAALAAAIGIGVSLLAPAGLANAIGCQGEDGPEALPAGIFDVREFSMQDTGRGSHLGQSRRSWYAW
jgi:hypothetical protein